MLHRELVASIAVGQRPDAHLGAAVRRVVVLHEGGELRVGGIDFGLDRLHHGVAQTLLIGGGNLVGEFQHRLGERTLVAAGVGDLLRLRR